MSESVDGRPIEITSDTNTAATALHQVGAADVIENVWLEVFNVSDDAVDLELVVQPADDTDASDVGDATLTIAIPRKSSLFVLEGHRFRLDAATNYTIGAYVATADIAALKAIGWYNRHRIPTTA